MNKLDGATGSLSLSARQGKYFPCLPDKESTFPVCQTRKVLSLPDKESDADGSSYSFISKSGWTIYVLGWKWQMWQTACWTRKYSEVSIKRADLLREQGRIFLEKI